jgi:hypothetical protein
MGSLRSTEWKLVIGPWTHGGGNSGQINFPNSTIDHANIAAYDAAWQAGVFQDNWSAWNGLPAVKVYLMNATPGSEWTIYNTWPPPAQELTFYFTVTNGVGGLSGVPQTGVGQLPFTSNPSSPCPTLGGINNLESCATASPVPCGPWDQRLIESRNDVVVFTSSQLSGTVVGRMYADVWIQTTLPDVDVVVRMTDVYPNNGPSMLMAQGIQRARYRNGSVCPQPAPLSSPTRVRVDLGSTAYVFNAGHKLRVIVSAAAGPNKAGTPPPVGGYSINPQNGDEYIGEFGHNPTVGSISVLADPGQASALVVPQATPGSTPPDRRPNTTPCPQ